MRLTYHPPGSVAAGFVCLEAVMPTMPPSFRPAHLGDRHTANRRYEQDRRIAYDWRAWYSTARWRRLRREQLASYPLCIFCEAKGYVTPATICDHKERHGGDPQKFWDGPFQSLCKACHDGEKQSSERGGRMGRGV